jgi:CheY-like chemotaxis protein
VSDEELDAIIKQWGVLLVDDGELNRAMLKSLCREIERQTRSKARRSAQALAEAIDAGVDVRKVLETHAGL